MVHAHFINSKGLKMALTVHILIHFCKQLAVVSKFFILRNCSSILYRKFVLFCHSSCVYMPGNSMYLECTSISTLPLLLFLYDIVTIMKYLHVDHITCIMSVLYVHV